MTWLAQAYAVALAAAHATYVLIGFSMLSARPRRPVGPLFVAMAISMAVWAYALAHGGIAATPDAAVFWRRIAAVGWTTLFAFQLHFVLALTGHTRLLANRFTYGLLYLPAAAALYVFALRGDLAARHAEVHAVGPGWTALAASTPANWAFFAYYASAVLASVVLIGGWGARASDPSVRAQARMLTWSFVIALGLGSLTDRVAHATTAVALPQVAEIDPSEL